MSGKKLYVGGLAYAVDDKGLEGLFAAVGKVESAKVITDYESGRSKGFGFVEMATSQDATDAIQKLNGTTHEGRTITVSEARPKEAGGRGGSAGAGRRGGRSGGGFGGGGRSGGNAGRDHY